LRSYPVSSDAIGDFVNERKTQEDGNDAKLPFDSAQVRLLTRKALLSDKVASRLTGQLLHAAVQVYGLSQRSVFSVRETDLKGNGCAKPI